jgi:pullulanase
MASYDQFGAYDDNRRIRFSVFFPGPQDYSRGSNPKIANLRVFGSFQPALGQPAWSQEAALRLEPRTFEGGTLYEAVTEPLADAFYQYKYLVTFEARPGETSGETRIVSDPCARYGGARHENSGVVIGGSQPSENVVRPLQNRLQPRDLIIYELMIDDFAREFVVGSPEGLSPIDAVINRLDYIRDLGFNAIEPMPWTAWPGDDFSWGYNPFLYFAVEHRYVDGPLQPAEKLSRLKRFISECHDRGLHMIMDCVFNHVEKSRTGFGFPYFWLYRDAQDCPFVGQFGEAAFLDELDLGNRCTEQFILDVCRYWINVFGIDGIRLDYTKGFFIGSGAGVAGLPRIISGIRAHLETKPDDFRTKFPIFIEHLEGYQAIDVTNRVDATGCWYDEMFWRPREYLSAWRIDERIVRLLNAGRDFGLGRGPITYISNHDHSQIAQLAGGRHQWFRGQPYLIALFTCCGAPLLYNGDEFAEDYWIPEGWEETEQFKRVVPRPKRWALSEDTVGRFMRQFVQNLIQIRKQHPALRSANFHPGHWESWMQKPDPQGYGVDVEKGTMVYRRWGQADDGQPEQFTIALNFSQWTRAIDIPLPGGGVWEDLLSGLRIAPTGGGLTQQGINSNWGLIFYKKG